MSRTLVGLDYQCEASGLIGRCSLRATVHIVDKGLSRYICQGHSVHLSEITFSEIRCSIPNCPCAKVFRSQQEHDYIHCMMSDPHLD
jgi:hypothetical protein